MCVSPAGEELEVKVIDTGHGLPLEGSERLFDAFFSTKREGLGMEVLPHSGGSAFVPQRLARPFIKAGELHRLPGSRIISLPAYLVFPQDRQDSISRKALEGLRLLGENER